MAVEEGADLTGIGSVIESMPGIAVLLSAEGFRVLKHNKEAEKYLPAAWRNNGAVGAKHSDFVRLDEKVSLAMLRRVSENRERVESREYAATMWSGRRIWLDWSAMPVENGTAHADVLVMARDVTDRKLAEEALKVTLRDREFLEFSVVNSSQPFASGSMDGQIIYFNRAFEELTRYSKEELKSVTWETELTPEKYRAFEAEQLRKLLETGEPVKYEKEYIRKDGTLVPIELLVHLKRDADGKPLYYYTFFNNLTDRKKVEDLLRRSEAKYRSLFENMSEMFELVEPIHDESGKAIDFRYIEVNKAAENYLRMPREEIEGKLAGSLFAIVDDRWVEALDRVVRTGKPVRMENHSEEQDQYFEVFAWKADEKRCAAVFTDVTEVKRGQRRLEEYSKVLERSNAELQQFAYVASHDLQEPLRMVLNFTALLTKKHSADLSPQAKEYLALVNEGADRMRQLVNDLLQYSRIDSQSRPFTEVDMNKVAAGVLSTLHLSLSEEGVTASVESLPTVFADESQMFQVLQNLLSNAIKFHGKVEPRVWVYAIDSPTEWVIAVKDNGIGIEQKYHDRIFQMFQRLHTVDEYPGTGIGLALSRKIIDRHGGRLWLDSVVREGSTFYFSIPKTATGKAKAVQARLP
ncbi:MAG TPA: PAS domain S-box protein [Methanomassiliicoccales archaeon]|nr:PAS domain S-box protein [Methanomassiliicoccales archaeon]